MVMYPSNAKASKFFTIGVCPPPENVSDDIGIISMNMACNALCSTQKSGGTGEEEETEEETTEEQYEEEYGEDELGDEGYEEEYGEEEYEEEAQEEEAPAPMLMRSLSLAKPKRVVKKKPAPKTAKKSTKDTSNEGGKEVDIETDKRNVSIVIKNITIESLTLKL